MTRRGSLAYYFAAIVCGCFFVALTYYLHSALEWGFGERWGRDLLFAWFLSVIAGFLPILFFAFLLRRAAGLMKLSAAWQWMALGVVAGLATLSLLDRAGTLLEQLYFPAERQRLKSLLVFPFVGPMMYAAKPLWLPIPAFAATAYVLYRIHRAFDRADPSPVHD